MNKDLQALLAVQTEDAAIRAVEGRQAGLAPRLRRLDDERRASESACARVAEQLERERRFQAALDARVSEHRLLLQRNEQRMNDVRTMRQATAAEVQVSMARQVVDDEERELAAVARRIADLEASLAAHQAELEALDAAQAEPRAELAREHAALEEELAELRRAREEAARQVPRTLLSQYDRIRRRRNDDALYALRGGSCGNCDTAIPLQRRNSMLGGARIEVCEECGVLLYAAP